MILNHEIGKHVELINPAGGQPLWRYVYSGKSKPYFHPLATPAGRVISLFEPFDHWWQRGLWFAIKFVNGHNFWEEKDNTVWGTQRTISPPTVAHRGDGVISIFSRLQWVGPGDAGVLLDEQRKIEYRAVDERRTRWTFSLI